jgi:16S rRNA (guanine527-N7)-methyltransferase
MTAAEAERLVAGAIAVGVRLDPEPAARIERFLGILELWNRRLRLTAEREMRAVVDKHVVDSLAAVPELPSAGLVIDVGSGAGFPGIVLGCLRPDLDLVLIDSRRRRVSFLREAIRRIPLPGARALEIRAECAAKSVDLGRRAAAVIARAIRLDAFLPLAEPLMARYAKAIAMQTPRTAEHAATAGLAWGLEVKRRHDYTLPRGAVRSLLVFARRNEAVP